MRFRSLIAIACLLSACAQPELPARELHVAAASDLIRVLKDLTTAFERGSHIRVVTTFGPTAQLTQQIENGAPYDVFLAADVGHVAQLVSRGDALADSSFVFARGRLAVWAPARPGLNTLDGLTGPDIRVIALAKPELAPYGAAALETLQSVALWNQVEKKVVYAPSIAIAKQFADTGNADAAFTALALVKGDSGHYFVVDEKLHKPIDEAVCIMKASSRQEDARAFTRFLAGEESRAILKRFGFTTN